MHACMVHIHAACRPECTYDFADKSKVYFFALIQVHDLMCIYINFYSCRWRCPNKCCRKVKSIRHDSWFSQSHLTLEQILEVTFLWTEDMPGETARKWVRINKNTIVTFAVRYALCIWTRSKPRRLEGLEKWWRSTSPSLAKENITAAEEEKDSGFGEAWREVLTKCLCKSFHRVIVATLLPVIIANVKPGTEIHTDEWRSYARLNRRSYVHHTVNHSIEFVNPANGAHTQSIELHVPGHTQRRSTRRCMHGTSKALFPTYLVEFIWRRKILTPFAMLINCITVVYPLLCCICVACETTLHCDLYLALL